MAARKPSTRTAPAKDTNPNPADFPAGVVVVDRALFDTLVSNHVNNTGAAASNNAASNLLSNAALEAARTNLGNTNSSTMADAVMKMLTAGRSDEDVNGVETLRSMNLAWPLNMKMVTGAELGKVLDTLNQTNQSAWNAINQANVVNSGLIADLNAKLISSQHGAHSIAAQPFLFTENAPASKDTPNEGGDEGATKTGTSLLDSVTYKYVKA